MKFLIAIEPGTDDTAYGVVVPDLPGYRWMNSTARPSPNAITTPMAESRSRAR